MTAAVRGRLPEPLPRELRLEPVATEAEGGSLCWSGWCPGCGRPLISATTHYAYGSDHHWCTRACREANR